MKKPQPEKPKITFEEWVAELRKVTAKETSTEIGEIIIHTEAAREWYDNDFTPETCFRETYMGDNEI